MEKTFTFGKIAWYGKYKANATEVTICLEDKDGNKPCFSASGAIWNTRHTDWSCGGQCLDEMNRFKSLRNNPTFAAIYRLWKKWHLNDMKAGTIEQEAAVDKWLAEGHRYDYTEVCAYLKSINLYEVPHPVRKGEMYKYGHEWIYRPIDAADLAEIRALLAS